MPKSQPLVERDLAALAKRFRKQSQKRRAEVARELGVAHPSVFNAEESPEQSLTRLRIRMIEKYSPYRVVGPVYLLKRK